MEKCSVIDEDISSGSVMFFFLDTTIPGSDSNMLSLVCS